MERLNPHARTDEYGSKINRDHSIILSHAVPWGTILLGSLAAYLPLTSGVPILPPLGFMMLLAWRLMRPGLLPVWAGFPLGLWDDLFSGQPFGSAILLFSAAMLAIEGAEMRFPWRSFFQDWLIAGVLVTLYLLLAMVVSGTTLSSISLLTVAPQIMLSVVTYPLFATLVSGLDRVRLLRIRKVG